MAVNKAQQDADMTKKRQACHAIRKSMAALALSSVTDALATENR